MALDILAAAQAFREGMRENARERDKGNDALIAYKLRLLIGEAEAKMQSAVRMQEAGNVARIQADNGLALEILKQTGEAAKSNRDFGNEKFLKQMEIDADVASAKSKGELDTKLAGLKLSSTGMGDYTDPEGEEAVAGSMAVYKIPLPSGFAMSKPYWQRVVAKILKINPAWDYTKYGARKTLRESFEAKKDADITRAMNTLVGHLSSIYDNIKDLDNSGFKLWNRIKNLAAKEVPATNPDVANALKRFQADATAAPGELASVYKGTGAAATDQEMKEWRKMFDNADSPNQILSGIDEMFKLMFTRLRAHQNKWETGMAMPKDFHFLSDEARSALTRFGFDPDTLDPMQQSDDDLIRQSIELQGGANAPNPYLKQLQGIKQESFGVGGSYAESFWGNFNRLANPENLITAPLAAISEEQRILSDTTKSPQEKLNELIDFQWDAGEPILADGINKIKRGLVKEGMGDIVGLIVGNLEALAIGRLPKKVPVAPSIGSKRPGYAEAQNVMKSGVPLSATTASGEHPLVAGLQAAAESSPGGSAIATGAQARTAGAIARRAQELAQQTGGTAQTPLAAGESVRAGVEGRIKQLYQEGTAAYNDWKTRMDKTPVSVDVAKTQAAIRPIWDEMQAIHNIDPSGIAAGDFRTIQRFMEANSKLGVSAIEAEEFLSGLKRIVRKSDSPYMRNIEQGTAAKAVGDLETRINTAVNKADPVALTALESGRKAWKAKAEAAETLSKLRDEPAVVFDQLLKPNDKSIKQLEAVLKESPESRRELGSAYLQKAIESNDFTAIGKLGARTKAKLFQDPTYTRNLEEFFSVADKALSAGGVKKNIVRVHTGLSVGAASYAAIYHPSALWIIGGLEVGSTVVAKMLRSPRAVKLLTQGMKIPIGEGAKRAAIITELQLLAKQAEQEEQIEVGGER
jgi:hypothetical protein